MFYNELIDCFTDISRGALGEKLTGIYLHGSLAMGCFHPQKSDIDLIVVVETGISDRQKMQFMEQIVRLNSQAPPKGLEVSVVKREYCKPFVYPTPYELHFSSMHLQWFYDDPQGYVANMRGEDIDLAAHFSIINHYGIVLYGKEIREVFSDVPRHNYIDSICADIEHAKEDIVGNPVYVILNLCRVLAFLKDGLYASKETGGRWALGHLTVKNPWIISDALECYAAGEDMTMDKHIAEAFAGEMLSQIEELI